MVKNSKRSVEKMNPILFLFDSLRKKEKTELIKCDFCNQKKPKSKFCEYYAWGMGIYTDAKICEDCFRVYQEKKKNMKIKEIKKRFKITNKDLR